MDVDVDVDLEEEEEEIEHVHLKKGASMTLNMIVAAFVPMKAAADILPAGHSCYYSMSP